MTIPPKGYGAVESIVWDYSVYLKKLGHQVDITDNTRHPRKAVAAINQCRPDIAHVHHPMDVGILNKIDAPVTIFTLHDGAAVTRSNISVFLCRHLAQYLKDGLFAFVLSPARRKVFLDCGYHPAEVFVTPNGADHRRFRFRKTPLHENRSLYLGRILDNKRQHLY